MNKDYGKMAYLKVIELEKQMLKLKKQLTDSAFNSLVFNLGSPDKRLKFVKKIRFYSNGNDLVTISVNIQTQNNLTVNATAVLNGRKLFQNSISNGNGVINLELGVDRGECLLQLTFEHESLYSINDLTVTINGKVEYAVSQRSLSSITLSNKNYVSYLNDNNLQIFKYTTEGGVCQVFEFDGVVDGSICGFINGELYVVVVNKLNELLMLTYNENANTSSISSVLTNGVTSVCGYPYGDGIKIYFILGGQVYSGEYVSGETFKERSLNRKGVKITADADCINAYIVTDAYGLSKLVI